MTKPNIWSLSDLCTPWCVHVVATLRIADHIAAGINRIEDLAAASSSHGESLHRVLRHVVGQGVFVEPSPGYFELNETARGLLDSPIKLGLDLDSFGGRMAYAWGSLLTAVRTGKPAYDTVFGLPFWEDLEVHPELSASFDALMGPPGHGIPDADVLLNNDWDSVHTVVDVGGGSGALLAEVLRAHPHVRGVLVDLQPTVARSSDTFSKAGVADRVTTVGQSFFEPISARGDLFLLKSVLGDWPDREAALILKRCADAMKESAESGYPNARLVLVNGVSPDDDRGPSPALLMMVLVGGKDRSLTEFRELAREAGLEVTAAGRQASGRFLVECK